MRTFIDAFPEINSNANIFLIDNFLLEKNNEDQFPFLFEQIKKESRAFWLFSGRNSIEKITNKVEIKELSDDDCRTWIESCSGFTRLEENNKKQLIQRITNITHGLPIYLSVAIRLLEKLIHQDPKEEVIVELSQFIDMSKMVEGEYKRLAFYFEMGKSDIERDCFHILSCLPIWDDFTMKMIREGINLYLLNANSILESDSMVEIVSGDSIKLHDEIRESLFNSPNNRIKDDVIAIMYRKFLSLQEKIPITDVGLLENFLNFTYLLCQGLNNGKYTYMKTDPVNAYEKFFNVIKNLKKEMKDSGNPRIYSPDFLKLYNDSIEKYLCLISFPDVASENKIKAFEELYEFGEVLYVAVDKRAERIFKRYSDEQQCLMNFDENNNSIKLSKGLSFLGRAQSLNKEYINAFNSGKESIEVVLKELQNASGSLGREFVEIYNSANQRGIHDIEDLIEIIIQLTSQKDIENCAEKMQQTKRAETILKKIKALDDSNQTKQLVQQILSSRGNIPWYLIKGDLDIDQDPIQYGKITYQLRRMYYGEDDSSTLTGRHNVGAYILNCSKPDAPSKWKICESKLKKKLECSLDIFEKIFEKRHQILERNNNQNAKDELILQLNAERELFGEIFSDAFIKEFFQKTDEIVLDKIVNANADTLESLQYQSDAKRHLALLQSDENEKIKLLNQAIALGNQAVIGRMITLGLKHKKTIESISYTAEYYKELGEQDKFSQRKKIVDAAK